MNGEKLEWQRPKTTRRYLHPTKSERMYTLWREGKIIFARSDLAVRGEYFDLVSSGMWLLHGEGKEQFDFRKAENVHREDGIPIHGLKFKLGELDLAVEAFSDFALAPRCYVELRVKNNSEKTVCEELSFVLRTGKEAELIYSAPDLYAPYAPDVNVWRNMESTWRAENGVYTDGEGQIKPQGNIDFEFCAEEGIASASLSLLPGEERVARFAFDFGEVGEFDYDAARAACVDAWERELNKINKLPKKILEDKSRLATVRNLTAQMLQCFTRPRGYSFTLARQGGLQRQVWTYETMPVLESLSRIGDFDDYIEPIIDVYFNEFYSESGEVKPFAIPWAMATANVLQSFGEYVVRIGNRALFEKYADRAYGAFGWIKNTRMTEEATANTSLVAGLFPPMRSCDDEFVFQSWASTDMFNIRGLRALLEAFRFFGDERAQSIEDELNDYISVANREWQKYLDKNPNGPLTVPFSPSLPDEVVRKKFTFSPPLPYFIDTMNVKEEHVEKIIANYTEKGMIRGGLYDRMPDSSKSDGSTKYNLDENGRCIVWYVANQEYFWFLYFMRHGMTERAGEILRDNEKFAMTDEYYMQERYNQRDPYFNPWSPNASANGRTVIMMLDYYKD